MTCRIGISTDPERRKAEWENLYRNIRDWQILAGPFNLKSEAQQEETRLAQKHSCESHAGGDDSDNPFEKWYVYGFNHDGPK